MDKWIIWVACCPFIAYFARRLMLLWFGRKEIGGFVRYIDHVIALKERREASMNAVIIQIAYGKRYVSIEYTDEEMLPKLNELARRIIQSVDISDTP